MKITGKFKILLLTALAIALPAIPAARAGITMEEFTGTGTANGGDGGGTLGAEAIFTLENSTTVLIQIINDANNSTANPNTVLGAVFFGGITVNSITSQTLPGGEIWTSSGGTPVTPGSTLADNGLELWQTATSFPHAGQTGGLGFGGNNYFGAINKQKDGLIAPGNSGPGKDTTIQNEIDLIVTSSTPINSLNVDDVSFLYGTAANYDIPGTLQAAPEANPVWFAILLVFPLAFRMLPRQFVLGTRLKLIGSVLNGSWLRLQ